MRRRQLRDRKYLVLLDGPRTSWVMLRTAVAERLELGVSQSRGVLGRGFGGELHQSCGASERQGTRFEGINRATTHRWIKGVRELALY